ncbi:MAG: ATP synthase F1 subunit gamma [Proteobacteria bacterium]|nr:ATP synthase F1 subunit gamma [Pseudomonadota bacterium]
MKETKRRIGSVKNTEKITNAMQLVSASKYARTLHKKQVAAKYLSHLSSMLDRCVKEAHLSKHHKAQAGQTHIKNSVLAAYQTPGDVMASQNTSPKELLVVLSADRGLCGALNAQLIKKAASEITALQGRQVEVLLWGKKAWTLASQSQAGSATFLERCTYSQMAQEGVVFAKSGEFLAGFQAGRWQRVRYVLPVFENVLVQNPLCQTLLPLDVEALQKEFSDQDSSSYGVKLLSEPASDELAVMLASQVLYAQMHYALLEMEVCEHAARMTAMDNATKNASEVIKQLTLEYNRVRQAAITTELVEITSGAEAL